MRARGLLKRRDKAIQCENIEQAFSHIKLRRLPTGSIDGVFLIAMIPPFSRQTYSLSITIFRLASAYDAALS
jgi:hypothetical protein